MDALLAPSHSVSLSLCNVGKQKITPQTGSSSVVDHPIVKGPCLDLILFACGPISFYYQVNVVVVTIKKGSQKGLYFFRKQV